MENNIKIPKLSITTISESDFSTYCEFGCFESDKKEIDCRVIDKDGSATKIANKIVKAVNNHDKLIEALSTCYNWAKNGGKEDLIVFEEAKKILESIDQNRS